LPGRSPREAVDDFLEPLKDTLACIARAKFTLSRDGRSQRGKTHALILNKDEPVKLKCNPVLMLRVGMHYEIVPNDREGQERWRISTRAYSYELQSSSGELVWSYHWHPTSRMRLPHIHLGRTQLKEDAVLSYKAHHPTARVSLESIVRACITEYGVQPLREDWEQVLTLRESQFEAWRRWP